MFNAPPNVTTLSSEKPNSPKTIATAMPTGRYIKVATTAPITASCGSELSTARTGA
jgi:hypothetical protein